MKILAIWPAISFLVVTIGYSKSYEIMSLESIS